MYLQKLEIQGFKSFADKTTLEFTPGITAIVGPNGSGKSNIADAVRWALGEQSLKNLRGKKSGDVIFAGSDKKPRQGYCQVDLYLNNEDRKAPIDYSEIVISRKMSRDGEGEYFINKNRVRLHDILMLLAKSNFGQRSYSIISQGTVDTFLTATPSQRKEYFDEAAGVRQFQIKKDQAENKLRQTKENLSQADLLIQEIDPRLRSLTRQVHRLERREEVTKQLKETQTKYYTGLWHDLKNKHSQEESNYQKADAERSIITEAVSTLQHNMRQLASGSSRQELFQKLQREYDQLVTEKNKLLREQASLKGGRDNQHIQQGNYNLVWLERRQESLKQDVESAKLLISDVQKQISEYTKTDARFERELQEVVNQHLPLTKKLNEAKDKLKTRQSISLPAITEAVNNIYNKQKDILLKIESVQTPEAMRSIQAEVKALTSQIAQLNHKMKSAGSGDPLEIIALQEDITKLLNTKDALTKSLNDIQIKLLVAKEKEGMEKQRQDRLLDEFNQINNDLQKLKGSKNPAEEAAMIAADEKRIHEKIKALDDKLNAISSKQGDFNKNEQQKKEDVFDLQDKLTAKQKELDTATDNLNTVKVELAKLETHQEDLEKEMVDEMSDSERDAVYEATEHPPANPGLFNEIQKIKRQLELIGGIDPQVAEEFEETKERYDFLTKQSNDLNKAITDLEKIIANLEETIKKDFSKSFDQINKHFTQYFKILFNGGNASLSLIKEEVKDLDDEEADAEADDNDNDENGEATAPATTNSVFGKKNEKVITGIDIHATPPGKRLRGIAMLSGGERALTAIALICAIIHNNPSPFVILDEVDAALDESNSIRFASIIEKLTDKTQFIIITHNRATMIKSKLLYGVTMGDDGISKLLSMNVEEAEKVITKNN
ncbi:chromosome segregation protein SMC [Patescibacteria group bacterium]|nr:chromosome segregation protein SMC [Patescibacteria group bacterium]